MRHLFLARLLPLLLFPAALFAQAGGSINGARGIPQPNDGSTGTTLAGTAVINSSGNAVNATTASSTFPTYVVIGGAGTSGSATLGQSGLAPCKFDSVTASAWGFYVVNSTTTNTECHAQAAAPALGVWVIGFLEAGSTAVGANANVLLDGFFNSGSLGGQNIGSPGSPVLNIYLSGSIIYTTSAPLIWTGPEGSCGSATAGKDILCIGSSSPAGPQESINGGTFLHIPQLIASGTATMTSGSVTTNTCQTAVTVAASGVLTTDMIEWAYATAPGTADALLDISQYVTSNNVNFTRCNSTNASQTGTAIVINWAVVR